MSLQPDLFDDIERKPKTKGKLSFQPVPRSVDASSHSKPSDWAAPEIPTINGERHIILNSETNGLKWWRDHRPIGWSYLFPESGRRGYLPIRHKEGNLPIEQVHAWLRDIRGMHVSNQNMKFDLHMSRVDGVDLTEQSNTFGDTMHDAALLDDNRRRFSLDELSKDLLGWDVTDLAMDPLGKLPAGVTSEADWWQLPSWAVAPYAIRNVEQVRRLLEHFDPQIDDEGLEAVRNLEQDVIPVVVEIEKNGVYLDMDLLDKWRKSARAEMEQLLFDARRATGVNIETPDQSKALEAIFNRLRLPITRTETGRPSFTGNIMKATKHPVILGIDRAGDLGSLLNKYLDKYAATMRQSDGWMRHNLHQLKSIKGEGESVGTVSGRFSAAGDRLSPDMRPDQEGTGGYNPQQVVSVERQLERGFLPEYVIRKLVKTAPGYECFFAADMMQVEYRLFAHYAKMGAPFHERPLMKKINGKDVWIRGPLADFHALVSEILLPINPMLNRKLVKNINFASIYGAGLVKFALMLGLIDEKTYGELRLDRSAWKDPRLAKAREVKNVYERMFPAVGPLLMQASLRAQSECGPRCRCQEFGVEHKGYVKDFLGRRARLEGRYHSSLNRVIQGGAATYNKRAAVEAYRTRKETGFLMQLTVHDELAGSLTSKHGVYKMRRVLNQQFYKFDVPILWDAKIGDNWAACK